MSIQQFIPGIICIAIALIVMFRLMHYAKFYAPSYFFWMGVIIIVVGLISLIHPLLFLFIMNRTFAVFVVFVGVLVSATSLLCPVKIKHSTTHNQKEDELLPEYAFNEVHEVQVKASVEKAKQILQITGVKDIPAVLLLMKIRGIADEDVDMSDRAAKSNVSSDTVSTPDFNFFVVAPDEWITRMILKSTMITIDRKKPAPPEISSLQQFASFNESGYVKVTANFRFIPMDTNNTLLTTETRVKGITQKDNRTFGYYWRIIYPGSAIIRRGG